MKILIIRQDHLGDLVLTTPLIRALHHAGHQVTVIARQANLPALDGNPHISALIPLEKLAPNFPKRPWVLGAGVRSLMPDLVLVPHASPSGLLVGLRCGYLGPIIAMWGGVMSRILLCRSLRSDLQETPRPISDIWLDMARAIGVTPAGLQPEIFLSADERDKGRGMMEERCGSRPVVIIHPGCSGNTCNLPIGSYADFIEKLLSSTDAGVVLTGIVKEREMFSHALSGFSNHPRVWNTMGQLDLRQLCSVISASSVIVSVGTGPLHLASALAIPTVSPFCQKVGVCAKVWGNLGARSTVLEPSMEFCAQKAEGVHCNFNGSINSGMLLEASLPYLN